MAASNNPADGKQLEGERDWLSHLFVIVTPLQFPRRIPDLGKRSQTLDIRNERKSRRETSSPVTP